MIRELIHWRLCLGHELSALISLEQVAPMPPRRRRVKKQKGAKRRATSRGGRSRSRSRLKGTRKQNGRKRSARRARDSRGRFIKTSAKSNSLSSSSSEASSESSPSLASKSGGMESAAQGSVTVTSQPSDLASKDQLATPSLSDTGTKGSGGSLLLAASPTQESLTAPSPSGNSS